MGDTIVPVKQFIIKERQNLNYFRGALLPEYRRALDELFTQVENLSAAITMAEHLPRSEAMLLAMLVSERAAIVRLENSIARVEALLRLLAGPSGE